MGHDHDFDFSFFGHDDSESSDSELSSGEGEASTWLLDNVELITVGVDIGSSTTHLVFSKLHLQRLAQSLSSRFVVVERKEIHRSPILLTPFAADGAIDVGRLSEFIDQSYRGAGVEPADVDTGVVILTGVALERRNSRAVAELFAAHGGKFVCASAGHNLEGILAAFGSGAVALSRKQKREVLHIDIGGGTSKLALIRDGEVLETSAISVGARLLAFDEHSAPIRIESAAYTIAESLGIDLNPNRPLSEFDKERFAEAMAKALFASAFAEEDTGLSKQLMLTAELSRGPVGDCLFSFSGGVSEYLFDREAHVFNDMAKHLTAAIKSELSSRAISITPTGEGIRATAIGASQFTVQLSGNTILLTGDVQLPLHNLPVVCPRIPQIPTRETVAQGIATALTRLDLDDLQAPICVYLPWRGDGEYSVLFSLAAGVSDALRARLAPKKLPLILALDIDLGAALGRILSDELNFDSPIVSIDGVELRELDYVDLGEPIEPTKVLPVMVKSLAFPTVVI
ncbi:MAG: reactivating factor for ethanolamine ammonia lyase [Actinomycetota bacterium]|nr:MAG: reactivating factor for ethanolamine ammonia lyase [Actinomycetota bacterium]